MRAFLFPMLLVASIASAQSGQTNVVRRLPNYQCMGLASTPEQRAADQRPSTRVDDTPFIYSEPRPNSERLTRASASLIVTSPIKVVNGYAEILNRDGRRGWIARSAIEPWSSVALPNAKCYPAMMSNGQPGFDYR